MSRKGRSRRANDDPRRLEDDDTGGSAERLSTMSDHGTVETALDPQAELSDLLEKMSEKRGSTRIAAFKSLAKLLQASYAPDNFANRWETINMHLESALRKGTGEEIVVVCNVLSLEVITRGGDAEAMWKDFAEKLEVLAKDATKQESIRAAAVEAYALLTFVAGTEQSHTTHALQSMEELFTNKANRDAELLVPAALNAWSLLVTSLPESEVAATTYEKWMPVFRSLLENESLAIRTAAGEAMALVYAVRSALLEKQADAADDEPSDDAVTEEKTGGRGPSRVDLTELAARLEELSTDGSRHRNKKDRKHQRFVFRDIMRTFESGDLPSEIVTVGSQRHAFEGWSQLRRLDSLRGVLEAGLLEHLSRNPLLSEIFDVSLLVRPIEDDAERAAKRTEMMSASKAKARSAYEHDTKQRKKKLAHVAGDDDDD